MSISIFVSFAMIFYDALTGKVVPPGIMSCSIDGQTVRPITKAEGYAVFTALPQGETMITVSSPIYETRELTVAWQEDMPVYQVTLFPKESGNNHIGVVCGKSKGLTGISAVLETEDLKITVNGYDNAKKEMMLQNLRKKRLQGSVAVYKGDKQWFSEMFLNSCIDPGRCTVNGTHKKAELTGSSVRKIYGGYVDSDGNYRILIPKTESTALLRLESGSKVRFQQVTPEKDNS